jgi:hypothetical protein
MKLYFKEEIMFENKVINGYTYASRFIASWIRSGGTFGKHGQGYDDFRNWLKSLGFLSDEDIECIMYLARNGKLELEVSAKNFIKNNIKKNSEEEA